MNTASEPSVGPAPSTNGFLDSLDFLRASLSSVQANIFVADTTFNIVYVNDRAMETLRAIEGDIREAFDVEVEDIVGGTIHRFHKDRRRVEAHPTQPAGPAAPGRVQLRQNHAPDHDQRRLRTAQRGPRVRRQLGGHQRAPAQRIRAVAPLVHAGQRTHERADGRPRPEDHLRQPLLAGDPAASWSATCPSSRRMSLGSSIDVFHKRPGPPAQDPVRTTKTCRSAPISRSARRWPTFSSPPFTIRTRTTSARWSPGS